MGQSVHTNLLIPIDLGKDETKICEQKNEVMFLIQSINEPLVWDEIQTFTLEHCLTALALGVNCSVVLVYISDWRREGSQWAGCENHECCCFSLPFLLFHNWKINLSLKIYTYCTYILLVLCVPSMTLSLCNLNSLLCFYHYLFLFLIYPPIT